MTYPMENLTPQLVKPLESEVRLGQGIIRSWDNETFENVVEWRGQMLSNVNVLAGTDALSYRAGDPVVLIGNGLGMGTSSWFILGRAVVPGPGTGAEVVEFMQSGLVSQIIDDIVTALLTSPAGEELAAFVIGQRVHTANDNNGGNRSAGTGFGNLASPANVGPLVSDVQVSEAGKAVVLMTARQGGTAVGNYSLNAYVGVAVSGATTVSAGTPGDVNGWQNSIAGIQDIGESFSTTVRLTSVRTIENLNPGVHTFTLQYAATNNDANFSGRSITVIAL